MCAFAQLLQAGLTSFVDLDDSLAQVAPPTKGSPSIRMDPNLLYARLPRRRQHELCQWPPNNNGAASAYLEATTVNLAEYSGMNNGVQAALEHTTETLAIVGDSRLAIQQSLGGIACPHGWKAEKHRELTAKFRSVKYLHVVREFNAAADSLASETLESKVSKVVSTETRLSELVALNRIQDVIYEPTAKAEVNTIRAHNLFRFVQDNTETGRLTVTTRQQAKANKKRVRFTNETSVVDRRETDSQAKANDTPTKDENHVREEQPGAEDSTSTAPSANDIDPLMVRRERRRRIAVAQDEELRWYNLKTVLRGEDSKLGYRAARDSWKMSDRFTLSEDNVLYYLGTSHRKSDRQQEETILRLVVPSTMVQEVLQNCHDSLEGGHQGIVRTFNRIRQVYYWIGLYADVERHVRSCPDCSSSKSRPQLRGYSPGNVLAERPFQLVSMDFVIPLPKSRRGNTVLLLFQCAFTSFVMGKAMADTTALCVAKAFEECVYRRFGAPTMIRHDRDPRFMSEVFQAFTEMMQSRTRATLSYRPQANGQQERSVKTFMQSVRVYAEDPLQQDWDEIAEKLIFAINNSMDATRKETPVYLVHGWDAQSTLRAMTSSLKRGSGKQTDALEEPGNTMKHSAGESKLLYRPTEPLDEARSVSGEADDTPVNAPRPLFEPGDRVWLYMERVKPGLTKKLAHRWHGPFRVKRKVEEFAYLELPDRSGYRFYPVVHVSRLKAVNEFGSRPKSRLTPEVTEETRLDFDEELLPEDSWELDQLAGEYEVGAILDDRVPLSTSTERAVREFK
ncbi:LOW QUALITY PROTEIN: Reverse transcriptase, partial [Phytophthora palmivora]